MSYTEITLPNMITNIQVGMVKILSLCINYADGSKKKVRVREGDQINIKYVKDGTLINATGNIVSILGAEPSYALLVDASEVQSANKVTVGIMCIRDITNLTDPNTNQTIPAPIIVDDPPVTGGGDDNHDCDCDAEPQEWETLS